ncbi:MAG: ABC transporter permease [Candidatus Gracilibacteria bacterium]
MLNIALNTFKEITRNKFLYLILFFAFVFIIFSVALGKLTIGDDNKIIVDFGLAMIEIFGLVGVLFVGSQLLFKEIEGKTIFLILSKPIKRYEFILGKFMGFSATIALIVALQSILFLIVLALKGIDITSLITFSLLFTFFKLEILLSLVFFFSTFMGNMLTILVTLMIYFLSHSFTILIDIANRSANTVTLYLAKGLQLLFPPFEALNIKDVIGSFSNFNANYFLLNSAYSIAYLTVILFFTVLIFNKKKFEN